MEELNNHKIYRLLNDRYSRLALDYVILLPNSYTGLKTHQEAVIQALDIIGKRYDCNYDVLTDEMQAIASNMDDLLTLPTDDYYNAKPTINRGFNIPDVIPYWYAFLEPPYGNPYLTRDFIEFNDLLFPNKGDSEVYRWNDGFSSYFDDGKEWWGTGLWSIYDKITGIIVIIGASATD